MLINDCALFFTGRRISSIRRRKVVKVNKQKFVIGEFR